ncbi:MAG: hypothetical protein ABI835_15745 [Chloroflexota bacterium]
MRRRLFATCFIVLALEGVFTSVFAQDTPLVEPISTLEAGDFRALAVTADGERLLVADAENQQVRVYSFSDPANPELLSSLDVSGTPVLVVGGDNFGLVAIITEDETDAVEVIAPALTRTRVQSTQYVAGRGYVDIAKNPRALALSPDNHWGIAVSENSYTLMQIHSADDIDSLPGRGDLIGAALSNTTAYLLRDGVLESAPLQSGEILRAEQRLALDGTPTAVALNADASAGVVVVDGSRLVFFDAASLERTHEFRLDGSPITSIDFMAQRGGDTLLITQEDTRTIRMINAAEPENTETLTTVQALDKPIRALAVFNQYLIATDGITISIFSS